MTFPACPKCDRTGFVETPAGRLFCDCPAGSLSRILSAGREDPPKVAA